METDSLFLGTMFSVMAIGVAYVVVGFARRANEIREAQESERHKRRMTRMYSETCLDAPCWRTGEKIRYCNCVECSQMRAGGGVL